MISEVEFKTFCNDFVKKYENQCFYKETWNIFREP